MKTDESIYKITLASINRSIMDIESWNFSKISNSNEQILFELEENELPVFIIESSAVKTLIPTRRILEKKNNNSKMVYFNEVEDIIYGDFKKQINKPELSLFRVLDFNGEQHEFQMETGKASLGLITSINTILKLRACQ